MPYNQFNDKLSIDVGSGGGHGGGSGQRDPRSISPYPSIPFPEDSTYGSISPFPTIPPPTQMEYVTIQGNVIRSVIPPGKGVHIDYSKPSQGYAPRPFNQGPMSPQAGSQRSPGAQNWQQPKPAPVAQSPYATMPRTGSQQGRHGYSSQTSSNTYNTTKNVTFGPNSYNKPAPQQPAYNVNNNVNNNYSSNVYNRGAAGKSFSATSAPKRGQGVLNKAVGPGSRIPTCGACQTQIRGPFITALGRIWCPDHFVCVNGSCRRPLQDIGFVEEKGDLYCEFCFEKYLAPTCSKCNGKIKGDCLNAIGKHFHPECFTCTYCGKIFGNTPFFLEDGGAYCEADWNELFTTKCFACGFPVEAGDRWVEALNHNYHSQCFNCTMCKKNLEGTSFFNKGGRPFCKNHAR